MDAACRLTFNLPFRAIFGTRHKTWGIDRLFCTKWEIHCSDIPVKYEPKWSTLRSKRNEEIACGSERSYELKRSKNVTYSNVEPHIEGFGPTFYHLQKHTEELTHGSEFEEDERVSHSKVSKYLEEAKRMIVLLLSKRAYTTAEIRNKLLGRKISPDIVELVITDSQSRGLINDSLYAETYARSRWSSSSWGPRRIIDALVRKGVSKPDATASVNLVFHDSTTDSQQSVIGISSSSLEQLLIQASKQWLRFNPLPLEKRKARIIRWLQYRGFSWDVVSLVVKRLQQDHPPNN